MIDLQAKSRPDAIALETPDGDRLTYRDLADRTRKIAIGLSAAHAGGRAPRIGLVLPNGMEMAAALLGVTRIGAAAPFDRNLTEAELTSYFEATALDMLVTSPDENPHAVAAARAIGIPVISLDVTEGASGSDLDAPPGDDGAPEGDDVALVLLTSGSTGRAKITPLSHRNVCVAARQVADSIGLTADDRCLSMWQQHHVGGLVDLLLAPLAAGGTVMVTRGFDAPEFHRLLIDWRPTWFQGVPATFNELRAFAVRGGLDPKPNSLRLLRSVAAPLSPQLMREIESLFGVPVIQTFGMTEAGPLISSTRLPPAMRKPGSAGASCGTEIRISGSDGTDLGAGEEGEIAIRGDNVFSGYENDPEANSRQFRGGWFFTGDIGYLDEDGDLFLTGRIKQLINRGGEKINPQEVDNALLEDEDVAEAATFSVPHRTLGEDVLAAVALSPVARATPDQIRDRLRGRLARFKIPSRIVVVDALPRNSVGKIDRAATARLVDGLQPPGLGDAEHRDELEAYLAHLWAAELDLDQVRPNDRFAEIGGDSLSSLRIVLAVETAFGVRIEDDLIERLTTVRELADEIRRMGVSRDRLDRAIGGAPPAAVLAAGRRMLASRTGLHGAGSDLSAVVRSLPAAGSRKELRSLCDAITLYATPDELASALRSERPEWPLRKFRSQLQVRSWRRAIEREIARAPHARAWTARRIADHAFLYSGSGGESRAGTLIVAFGGNEMRLMLPTYRILLSLDPGEADLLLVSDPDRAQFAGGSPGLGGDLDGLRGRLGDLVRDLGHRRRVAIGTSGGGLAAIVVGVENGWTPVVAVGADDPARHPSILERLAALKVGGGVIRLCYSEENERDARAARSIHELAPSCELHPFPRRRHHNLFNQLHRSGELGAFFRTYCLSGDVRPLPAEGAAG